LSALRNPRTFEQFFVPFATPSLSGPDTLDTIFSNILSLDVRDQFSHPYQTTGKL
jgi:small neutral amino acid transporter SnatA (MarC family)